MIKLEEFILNLSLKMKWTLSTATVIFFSYAAICIVIYFSLYTWLINNEENNAIRTADDLSSFFHSQDGSITIQEFQRNTGLIKSIVNQNQTVRIFNLDGIEVLRINDVFPAVDIDVSTKQSTDTIVIKEEIDGEDVLVVNRAVQIGRFYGYMQLIHPLSTFQSMMKYVLTAMLIAGLGALLIAGSISYYLTNLLMKPLQDLRDSMISIREKGVDEVISFTYAADDEIGDLLNIYISMMEDLQQSFAKQQQFVSDASHELRTPIQAIEGYLSLIKRWGKDDPEVLDESLETSLIEVQRMKKMIEELLDLARNEERDQYAVANIDKVLKSVKQELQSVYNDAVIKIENNGEIKQTHISENALGQILRNIIENGIRYNENKPYIHVQVKNLAENILINIEDNGVGISNEHLPHIFNRFYRVDAARENKGGGTGLGLSITKMLAEKYNVEMDVTSVVGKGTTFTLKFPLKG